MTDVYIPELKWSDDVPGAREVFASLQMGELFHQAMGISPSVIVSGYIAGGIRLAQECNRLDDMPLLLRRYAELIESGAYTKAKGTA